MAVRRFYTPTDMSLALFVPAAGAQYSTTQIKYSNGSSTTAIFYGTFTYSGAPAHATLTGGTVTSFGLLLNNVWHEYTTSGAWSALTVSNFLQSGDADGLQTYLSTGADTIYGSTGADTMRGGSGDDIYIFDHRNDQALEDLNSGNDTVQILYKNTTLITETIDMGATAFDNVENMQLLGTGLFNITGNDLNNSLIGNASANTLVGGDGDDYLDGGAGADILDGGDGDDTYVIDNIYDYIVDSSGNDTAQVKWASGTYVLGTGLENLVLLGTGHLNSVGNAADNIITGNSGNNYIDGGIGADTMDGGRGNDIYIVDNVGDIASESLSGTNGGTDTVMASTDHMLGNNIEYLTLIGTGNINGTGNALRNTITGNDGNNILDGGGDIDYLRGGKGSDTYTVDLVRYGTGAYIQDTTVENFNEGTDIVALRTGGDLGNSVAFNFVLGANIENADISATATTKINITGNGLNNVLIGNDADNIINGGSGDDAMSGGAGNDIYLFDSTGDTATETINNGNDTVQIMYKNTGPIAQAIDMSASAFDNIENFYLLGTGLFNVTGNDLHNIIVGNAWANTFIGGDGHDYLDGGAGADILNGGDGDDIYVVDNVYDYIADSSGTDTVQVKWTSGTYFLGTGLENLTLLGTAHLNGVGNTQNNILLGNSGNNYLDGGIGADTMDGSGGNDIYIVDDVGDTASETGTGTTGGTDTVMASANHTLGNNIENLTLTGTAPINGTGNALRNTIIGNDSNNILDGMNGADYLRGGKDDDTYIVDLLRSGTGAYIEDTIVENFNEGNDLLALRTSGDLGNSIAFSLVLAANLENVDISGTATTKINITGNSADNILIGNAGDNIINGGGGNDTMRGGAGNDIYLFDSRGDAAEETNNNGDDTVQILYHNLTNSAETIDMRASSYDNIEHLYLLNNGLFNVIGNALNNILIGNASTNTLTSGDGNDYLDGGIGVDILDGGDGDDIYVIDNIYDYIADSSGTDTVMVNWAASTYILASDLENLTLLGTGHLNGVGNTQNNILLGNSGNNYLDAGVGADTMQGGKGNDTYIIDNVGDLVIESGSEGVDTIVQNIFDYTLPSNVENLILQEGSLASLATGNALNNVITGNSRDNVIDSATGIDILYGGDGNDMFFADIIRSGNTVKFEDTIIEYADQGTDMIYLRAGDLGTGFNGNIYLPNNIEQMDAYLTYGIALSLGSANNKLNLYGNSADNLLSGNDTDNILDGGLGDDRLIGGNGNDIFVFDSRNDTALEYANEGNDTVWVTYKNLPSSAELIDMYVWTYAHIENMALLGTGIFNIEGNDLDNRLIGNASNNELRGNLGHDYLDGGLGADTMNGGDGDDTYVIDNISDVIIDSSGTDAVQIKLTSGTYSLGTGLENLTLLGTAHLNGTGNNLNNILIGNDGNNILDGGTGADTMNGGKGNDIYIVDNIGDVASESWTGATGGTDLVLASASHALGSNIENLTLTGTDNISGTGNTLRNTIIGNDGNNILDGGADMDSLRGSKGNDTYIIDLIRYGTGAYLEDTILENANEGIDTLVLRTSGDLGNTTPYALTLGANIENGDISGTSTTKINLMGNTLDNILIGNSADNIINGGVGNDTLTGGAGADRFTFYTNAGVDTITDFTHGVDKIVLSSLLAPNLLAPGTIDHLLNAAFGTGNSTTDTSQRVLYDQSAGNLYIDKDGSGALAPMLIAHLDGNPLLTVDDILITRT